MEQSIGGYTFNALTPQENKQQHEVLKAELGHHFSNLFHEQIRGIKPLKLPVVSGVASGVTFNLPSSDGPEPIICGPQQGYFWRIGRVTISSSGTDTGAASLYAGSDRSNFNQGNLVDNTLKIGQAYYPGTRGLFLWPGEQLYASLVSVANVTYQIRGIAIEVPAEMAGKILG